MAEKSTTNRISLQFQVKKNTNSATKKTSETNWKNKSRKKTRWLILLLLRAIARCILPVLAIATASFLLSLLSILVSFIVVALFLFSLLLTTTHFVVSSTIVANRSDVMIIVHILCALFINIKTQMSKQQKSANCANATCTHPKPTSSRVVLCDSQERWIFCRWSRFGQTGLSYAA